MLLWGFRLLAPGRICSGRAVQPDAPFVGVNRRGGFLDVAIRGGLTPKAVEDGSFSSGRRDLYGSHGYGSVSGGGASVSLGVPWLEAGGALLF